MHPFRKMILRKRTSPIITPPVGFKSSYSSGRYACIGGMVNILSPVSRGSIYWSGILEDNNIVYTDAAQTIVVPYGYVRVNTSPLTYLVLSEGAIMFKQIAGEPC